MEKCNLCPRKCNAIRNERENRGGFCKMPLFPRIAKADLHFWEEPPISGENGSGAVFFSGCNLGCVFCQNFEISHKGFGKTVSTERLAQIFRSLEARGAENINLVNPTHYVGAIRDALEIFKPTVPMVYNTSGYESTETVLNGFTDIYLFDLKYKSSEKSRKYSAAEDYFSVASEALIKAYCAVGKPVFDDRGMLKKGVVVRHLLLPSSTKDAIDLIEWTAQNCPDVIFSLMAQYTPFGDAEKFPEINRKITKREYDKVCSVLYDKNFTDIYVQ